MKEFFGSKEEEEVFNTVIESEEFKNADTFRSQISILAQNFLKAKGIIPFARIANSFNKSRQSIRNQYLKSLKPKKMNGRPPTLSKSEINIISEYIKKYHTNQSCVYFPSFSE